MHQGFLPSLLGLRSLRFLMCQPPALLQGPIKTQRKHNPAQSKHNRKHSQKHNDLLGKRNETQQNTTNLFFSGAPRFCHRSAVLSRWSSLRHRSLVPSSVLGPFHRHPCQSGSSAVHQETHEIVGKHTDTRAHTRKKHGNTHAKTHGFIGPHTETHEKIIFPIFPANIRNRSVFCPPSSIVGLQSSSSSLRCKFYTIQHRIDTKFTRDLHGKPGDLHDLHAKMKKLGARKNRTPVGLPRLVRNGNALWVELPDHPCSVGTQSTETVWNAQRFQGEMIPGLMREFSLGPGWPINHRQSSRHEQVCELR